MDGMLWICNLVSGLAIGTAVAINTTNYQTGVDRLETVLRERLRLLMIPTAGLRRWIHVWIGMTAIACAVIGMFFAAVPLALLVAALMAMGPWYYIRYRHAKRRQQIEDQLADAMGTFSSAIQAGLSVAQAMQLLATECPLPIRQEFSQLAGEYSLGKPLERTLAEAQERLKSEHFSLFAAAMLASRQSGGKLNDVVDRIARSVRELQRLRRKVLAETAQARRSALYMAIAPALILVVYYFVDPDATTLLFVTVPGQMILAAAIVLNLVAWLWARQILKTDL